LVLSNGLLYGVAQVGVQGISLGDGSIFKMNVFPRLNIALVGTNAVLTWDDPSYPLYTAPAFTNTFTEIIGAASPYTNGITGSQKYFELQ
jgi:hypothetical protein